MGILINNWKKIFWKAAVKKSVCCLAAFILFISSLLQPQNTPAQKIKQDNVLHEKDLAKALYARSAVLMDADTGRVLFGKDAENPMPMASTTKIMTCILTLENADLDSLVEVSAYAARMPDVQLNISQGEYYKLEDLLYSLMLESHNDSAVAIAEHVGGSVEGFAQMMNEKAASIGCSDTFFITPNGLDASASVTQQDGTSVTKVHSTTARDLAAIMSYCIKRSPKKEEFLKITRTASHSFHNVQLGKNGTASQGARSFSCSNHNTFLHMMEGALSGKTGFTGNAGYCYVGALESEGRTFVIALLACGWPNHKTWKWKDARNLFQYGMDNYKQADITNYDLHLNPIPVEGGAGESRLLKTKMQMPAAASQKAQNMLLSENDQIEVRVQLPKLLKAPVQKGQALGTVNYYVNGDLVSKMPVSASRSIEERDFGWYVKLVVSRYFYPYLT